MNDNKPSVRNAIKKAYPGLDLARVLFLLFGVDPTISGLLIWYFTGSWGLALAAFIPMLILMGIIKILFFMWDGIVEGQKVEDLSNLQIAKYAPIFLLPITIPLAIYSDVKKAHDELKEEEQRRIDKELAEAIGEDETTNTSFSGLSEEAEQFFASKDSKLQQAINEAHMRRTKGY